MKTRSTYSDRLEDLLAGLPPRDTGPRRAHQDPGEPADEQPAPTPVGPAPTRPPLVFGRAHLSALGIVLVLVLAVVAVMLLRSRATSVPVSAVSVSPARTAGATAPAPGPSTPSASAPAPSVTAATIRVHVAGRVRHPDVYPLSQGARVIDAVRAAGGLSAGAHPGALNLAAPVCDGCQVMIPASGDGTVTGPDGGGSTASPGPAPSSTDGAGSGTATGGTDADARIDLNRATSEQLQTLDGVGPATAAKIIAWRTQHGRFSDVSELQEIDGIGPKTYARLKDHVRV